MSMMPHPNQTTASNHYDLSLGVRKTVQATKLIRHVLQGKSFESPQKSASQHESLEKEESHSQRTKSQEDSPSDQAQLRDG